jgi:hypothetical protein
MPYNNQILGYMTEPELMILESLAFNVPLNGTIVEVGSFMGRSGVCLAMSAPTAKIYCIDDFYDHDWLCNHTISQEDAEKIKAPDYGKCYNVRREFLKNTENFENIEMIIGHCPDVEYTGPEIDLLFVDSSHQNPNDWDVLTMLLPYVKAGGTVCGHDYGYRFPDVVQNVSRLENILHIQRTLYLFTSIWSFRVDSKIDRETMALARDLP